VKLKLLSALHAQKWVVDVENPLIARPYHRADPIDKSGGELRRLRLARRIRQTTLVTVS
jgi:hypothetical protein